MEKLRDLSNGILLKFDNPEDREVIALWASNQKTMGNEDNYNMANDLAFRFEQIEEAVKFWFKDVVNSEDVSSFKIGWQMAFLFPESDLYNCHENEYRRAGFRICELYKKGKITILESEDFDREEFLKLKGGE